MRRGFLTYGVLLLKSSSRVQNRDDTVDAGKPQHILDSIIIFLLADKRHEADAAIVGTVAVDDFFSSLCQRHSNYIAGVVKGFAWDVLDSLTHDVGGGKTIKIGNTHPEITLQHKDVALNGQLGSPGEIKVIQCVQFVDCHIERSTIHATLKLERAEWALVKATSLYTPVEHGSKLLHEREYGIAASWLLRVARGRGLVDVLVLPFTLALLVKERVLNRKKMLVVCKV